MKTATTVRLSDDGTELTIKLPLATCVGCGAVAIGSVTALELRPGPLQLAAHPQLDPRQYGGGGSVCNCNSCSIWEARGFAQPLEWQTVSMPSSGRWAHVCPACVERGIRVVVGGKDVTDAVMP